MLFLARYEVVQEITYVTLSTSSAITALEEENAFAQNRVPLVAVFAAAVDRKAP
jgi:hypothetical protein